MYAAMLADGYDGEVRNIYQASDQGGLWVALTADEHAEVVRRLRESGVGDVLTAE